MTCILISHDFDTVRDADYIYVLEQGHLLDQGTHAQLMNQQSGTYLKLAGFD